MVFGIFTTTKASNNQPLRIREMADDTPRKGASVLGTSCILPYRCNPCDSTLRTYARSPGLATVDVTALQKLARTFDVMIEDLIEVVED